MKIKQIIMTSLLSFITAMTFIACSDDDSNNDIKIPTVSPKEQWLVNLMEGVEAKAVNSAGFIAAIRERLEKRLA